MIVSCGPFCPMCGADLTGRRECIRYCSGACRVEAWRLQRLLDGEPCGPYRFVNQRLAAWGTRGTPRATRAALFVQRDREGA